MGIKHLRKILRETSIPVKWNTLRGKVVAIDAPVYVYRWNAISRKVEDEGTKRIKAFTSCLLVQLRTLVGRGAIPLYVFEGRAPEEKRATIAVRAKSGSTYPSADTVLWVKEILDELGIPWTVAEGEAEALCAHMQITGRAAAVLTEDSDVLALGCRHWIHLDPRSEDGYGQIDLVAACREVGLTFAGFRRMCVLLGTDYSPTIMGPTTAPKVAGKWGAELRAAIPTRSLEKYDEWFDQTVQLFDRTPATPSGMLLRRKKSHISKLRDRLTALEYSEAYINEQCEWGVAPPSDASGLRPETPRLG